MDFIDLHIHTSASDGSDSPAEIVEKAKALGLTAIAVTDHDTLAGVEEAMARGREVNIEVIPGVELSVNYYGKNLHLLGYFTSPDNEAVANMLAASAAERSSRNERIVAMLAEAGYPITMQELSAAFPGKLLGRPHIANFLESRGCIGSVQEGFDTLLGEGQPFFIPRRSLTMGAAAAVLRDVKAVSSLAHPLKYGYTGMQWGALWQNVRCVGIAHLEAFYSGYTEEEMWELRDTAKEWDMDITGGSDYHGSDRPEVEIGFGTGDLRVPDWILEDMKTYRAEL